MTGKPMNVPVDASEGSRTGTARAGEFRRVRAASVAWSECVSAEDQVVQSMPDASPMKWHLAHTTWFFETFILRDHDASYATFDDAFAYLFNSYYEAEGPRHARPRRGLLTRPSLDRVLAYRRHVDTALEVLIDRCGRVLMAVRRAVGRTRSGSRGSSTRS